jgi:hypothetical protein
MIQERVPGSERRRDHGEEDIGRRLKRGKAETHQAWLYFGCTSAQFSAAGIAQVLGKTGTPGGIRTPTLRFEESRKGKK